MANRFNVAVVGATGAVGRVFLTILEERAFPVAQLKLLASKRSEGKRISVMGQEIEVHETTPSSFENVDFAFISVNADVSRQLAPSAVESGALVIDDSSAFRMLPNVPLVVPEINGADVEWHDGIISIPNCSTIQMVMVLYPLHRVNPIKRVVVDTFQAVSGAGTSAVMELTQQTIDWYNDRPILFEAFNEQIAFNVLPYIGEILPSGYTEEEEKMIFETQKILHDKSLSVSATCVRVPVRSSHSEAIHIEMENPMDPREVRQILSDTPGVAVMEEYENSSYKFPTPIRVEGTDEVYVGRIRRDPSVPNGIAMWAVADNLRKGAALNAMQIAEEVIRRGSI